MRSRALVAFALLLAVAGAARATLDATPPANPLVCDDVVSIDDPSSGPHLACADDTALSGCGSITPGLLYRGCEAFGTVPGALLVARGLPIDVRLASDTDLRALPGVGPSLARRIIERRGAGPLCGAEELEGVSGIGLKRVSSWRGLLAFHDARCKGGH